ncbi:MAG: hypothetical protein LBO66_02915 [Deltaproteobacteria bacterium]|nr:hypothetical protein [Deltaproteobacteria bacterium]
MDNARVRHRALTEAAELMATLKEEDVAWSWTASQSLNSGPRLGEILDFRWSDLDLEVDIARARDGGDGAHVADMNESPKAIF